MDLATSNAARLWPRARGFIRRHGVAIVFTLFFAFLLLQYSNVFLYHDDYGHASLSYGFTEPGVNGTEFTIGQLFHYLGTYAEQISPQVTFMFFDILLHRLGLTVTRIAAAALVCAFFALIYKLARPEDGYSRPALAAVVCVLTYGLCSVGMYRDLFYWFVALFSYIGGFTIFLLAVYLANKWTVLSLRRYITLIVLFFLASFGQENLFTMVFAYCALKVVFPLASRQKPDKAYLAGLCTSAVAIILPLLLADNKRYAGLAEGGLFSRVGTNYLKVLDYLFNKNYMLFFLLMAAIIFMCCRIIYKRGKRAFAIAGASFAGLLMLLSAATVSAPIDYLSRLGGNPALVIMTLFIALFVVICSMCFWQDKPMLILFWSGVASCAPCLAAPYIVARMFVFLQFTCGILFVRLAAGLYGELPGFKRWQKALVILPTGVFIACSARCLIVEYRGYAANYAVSSHNDAELRIARERIAMGENLDHVVLYKHNKHTLFTGDQPWWDTHPHIERFIREYYDISEAVEFRYLDGQSDGTDVGNTLESARIISGFAGDGWLEPVSEFRLLVGERGFITLKGWYPYEITPGMTGRVYVNGDEHPFTLGESAFELTLPAPPGQVATIRIENDFSFQAPPPDIRILSFIITGLDGE